MYDTQTKPKEMSHCGRHTTTVCSGNLQCAGPFCQIDTSPQGHTQCVLQKRSTHKLHVHQISYHPDNSLLSHKVGWGHDEDKVIWTIWERETGVEKRDCGGKVGGWGETGDGV